MSQSLRDAGETVSARVTEAASSAMEQGSALAPQRPVSFKPIPTICSPSRAAGRLRHCSVRLLSAS